MAKKTNAIQIERGSGNVFADLGFPDPEGEQFKATLMLQIYRIIEARKPNGGRQGAGGSGSRMSRA